MNVTESDLTREYNACYNSDKEYLEDIAPKVRAKDVFIYWRWSVVAEQEVRNGCLSAEAHQAFSSRESRPQSAGSSMGAPIGCGWTTADAQRFL